MKISIIVIFIQMFIVEKIFLVINYVKRLSYNILTFFINFVSIIDVLQYELSEEVNILEHDLY